MNIECRIIESGPSARGAGGLMRSARERMNLASNRLNRRSVSSQSGSVLSVVGRTGHRDTLDVADFGRLADSRPCVRRESPLLGRSVRMNQVLN